MTMKYKPKITILTDPIATGRWWLPQSLRVIARTVRNYIQAPDKKLNRSNYRGHFAVTRSLVEGLKKLDFPFNYNPTSVRDLADTVVVLAGVRTLRQALEFKKKGKIKTLSAGPNIVILSTDENSIIASPEIDIVMLNNDWIVDLYIKDNSSIQGRCWVWPAGVDTEYWKPDFSAKRKQILIYKKHFPVHIGPLATYVDYLNLKGFQVVILEYGNFTHDEYLRALQQSQLMIGFSSQESQGIAWAEAWSSDVPTLIWQKSIFVYLGRNVDASSAPYLKPENGLFFDDLDDFKVKFAFWETHPDQFAARAWTLANMSDEVCAAMLYKKLILPPKTDSAADCLIQQ
jgi:hypothetical protein